MAFLPPAILLRPHLPSHLRRRNGLSHIACVLGSTPDIVVLPGIDGTPLGLDSFGAAIAESQQRRVHALHLPHSLDSSPLTLCRDVCNAIPLQQIDNPHGFVLVAQSFSGHAALRLALRSHRPDSLRGVVLVNSFVSRPSPPLLAPIMALIAQAGPPPPSIATALTQIPDPVINTLLLGGTDGASALRDALLQLPAEVLCSRIAEALKADSTQIWRDRQALPANRVLVLRGGADRLVMSSAVHYMRDQRPDIKWHIVPDAPHLLLQTRAEECATVIDQFCQELPLTEDWTSIRQGM